VSLGADRLDCYFACMGGRVVRAGRGTLAHAARRFAVRGWTTAGRAQWRPVIEVRRDM
jgi:hypothetical protein